MATLNKPTEEMQFIIATDVGSTTTKARLFHKKDGEWRFFVAGEAPTTVEAPYEDVTMGVQNAVREIEELTGHMLLAPGGGMIIPYDGEKGVDLYCTTSSAGGGLQMMVSGLIKSMTAESANRAALGAGAIVMDVIARDDGRQTYQKIRRIRSLRPDMILMAGGTDGGASQHVMEIAELIKAAEPKPRLGVSYQLPIVYAGNKVLRPQIEELLKEGFALDMVDNIRPVLERENTEPARRAVHELFMEHVMSHAPGYNRLMKWTDIDIMPTPAGEGIAIQLIANTFKQNVMGVGLGGATTNVYSIVDGRFVRSVSANLGMSYSVTNVMKEAGIENIMRWIPFDLDKEEVASRLMN
ncbi:methylaspartate mutase, partial [Candidatus Bathyarchaeota archaeon]